MIRSLRIRLLLATSIASAVMLALQGIAIYFAMRHQLFSDFDAALLSKARMMATSVEQRNGRVHTEFDLKEMPEFSAHEHPQYFELWRDNGQVVARSESLGGADLPRNANDAKTRPGHLHLPGGHQGRAVVVTFTPRIEDEDESKATSPLTCTIAVVGTPIDALRMLDYLSWLIAIVCAAAIAVCGVILWRVVGRGIRPVKHLAQDIESVRESDLTYRLPDHGVPAELSPVVEKLNGLLDRLEKAFSREKAFAADVAHELRTPLAGLMATLEVCRSRQREVGDYEKALDACSSMTNRMQTMVENLLLVSRAETGHLAVNKSRFDMTALLRETWTIYEDRAQARDLKIEWFAADGCDVESDPAYLQIVIQNLFDNAVSYTDTGGDLRITTRCEQGKALIEISNSCSMVNSLDVSRIFDRFWRGDRNRAETGIHCGLGMSLSQRLVGILGGQINVDTSIGQTFVVRTLLPIASKD